MIPDRYVCDKGHVNTEIGMVFQGKDGIERRYCKTCLMHFLDLGVSQVQAVPKNQGG